jgi:esterase/lipase
MQGQYDQALAPDSAQIAHDRTGSSDKTLIWLENSGHNVLIDGEREWVQEETYRWIAERVDGKRRA